MEYCGLNPIPPFPRGRSDAARRVVIWPSCLSPLGTYGLYHGTTLVREGTRGWAGNSRPAPTAPPLPRTKWPILPIDRNVIPCCKLHINNAALSGLYASHLWGSYGFSNDAARCVVIWPSCLSPMGTYGLYHGTTLVREGTREKGEHSLRSASPLPRTKWPISPIDRNVIPCCKLHINNAALSGLYASHLKRPYVFYNDAARRVATVFEKFELRD